MTKEIGLKYGRLTVLDLDFEYYDYHGKRIKQTFFICKCECGTTKRIYAGNIRNGSVISCGCYRKSQAGKIAREYHDKHSPDAVIYSYFSSYFRDAKRNGIPFQLDLSGFKKFAFSSCYYCGSPPSLKIHNKSKRKRELVNGIDRVDSSKGYELSNIVACCKRCNFFKSNLSVEEFLRHVGKIYKHQKLRPATSLAIEPIGAL